LANEGQSRFGDMSVPKSLGKIWEGEASAEPETTANSEWFFWDAVFLHCRKISAHQEMCPSSLVSLLQQASFS